MHLGACRLPDVQRREVRRDESAGGRERDRGRARGRRYAHRVVVRELVHRMHEQIRVVSTGQQARAAGTPAAVAAAVQRRLREEDRHRAHVMRVRPAAVRENVPRRAAGAGGPGRFALNDDEGWVDAGGKDRGAGGGRGDDVNVGLVLVDGAEGGAELGLPELDGAAGGGRCEGATREARKRPYACRLAARVRAGGDAESLSACTAGDGGLVVEVQAAHEHEAAAEGGTGVARGCVMRLSPGPHGRAELAVVSTPLCSGRDFPSVNSH